MGEWQGISWDKCFLFNRLWQHFYRNVATTLEIPTRLTPLHKVTAHAYQRLLMGHLICMNFSWKCFQNFIHCSTNIYLWLILMLCISPCLTIDNIIFYSRYYLGWERIQYWKICGFTLTSIVTVMFDYSAVNDQLTTVLIYENVEPNMCIRKI